MDKIIKMTKHMPEIYVFSLGGTISMSSTSPGHAVSPALNGRDLLENIPEFNKNDNIHIYSPYTIPSSHLKLDQMMELLIQIKKMARENPECGFVITLGTDTLEEAAFFIDFTFPYENPVVFTGAMRNETLFESDGLRNIQDSILVASSPECRDLGALVVMNGQIHAARDVTKTHSTDVATFKSPSFGHLGVVHENSVLLRRKPLKREFIRTEQFAPKVELYKSVIGGDGLVIDLLLDHGIDGLVVEAFGGGHVTPEVFERLNRAISQGVPVVVTTRCHSGELLINTYDYAGSESDLRGIGAYFINCLTGPKARISLSLALGADPSGAGLSVIFPD